MNTVPCFPAEQQCRTCGKNPPFNVHTPSTTSNPLRQQDRTITNLQLGRYFLLIENWSRIAADLYSDNGRRIRCLQNNYSALSKNEAQKSSCIFRRRSTARKTNVKLRMWTMGHGPAFRKMSRHKKELGKWQQAAGLPSLT